MGRRTPWNLKNPKYQNPDGSLKAGYTYHPVNEGYSKVGEIKTQKRTGAGKDGTNYKITGARTIYKDGPSPKTVHAPAPAPKPTPAPPPPPKPKEPIKHSTEIEQAKDRVNAYENGKSPWEQAQANVESSFIKDTGSNSNNQYDFSGKTFEANQSSKPNEQAQAAQNQMQNYISKYSSFKSSNN